MKKFFSDLFNDNNSINEKAVIGFAALGFFSFFNYRKFTTYVRDVRTNTELQVILSYHAPKLRYKHLYYTVLECAVLQNFYIF